MQRDGGPGGAGGAGNPTGGAFTGPAETLELMGDHCYAFSGLVTDAGSGSAAATCLSFQSGNYYAVCEINWCSDSASSSQDEFVLITMNDTTIWNTKYTNAEVSANDQPIALIIPPYTKFVFKWGLTTDTKAVTVILTGRIYRGR